MKIPTVSRCCCCLELRTAGIVLGILALVGCVLSLAKVNLLTLIFILINIPLAILWLIGIFKDNTKFMLPNVIFRSIGVILSFFMPVYQFVIYHQLQNKADDAFLTVFIIPVIAQIIFIILNIYFFIVEYSLYRMMVEKETPQNQPNKFEA